MLETPMKGHHLGRVAKVKDARTTALKGIRVRPTVTPSMAGNFAGSDVSTQEEPILKPFNALHRSDQQMPSNRLTDITSGINPVS